MTNDHTAAPPEPPPDETSAPPDAHATTGRIDAHATGPGPTTAGATAPGADAPTADATAAPMGARASGPGPTEAGTLASAPQDPGAPPAPTDASAPTATPADARTPTRRPGALRRARRAVGRGGSGERGGFRSGAGTAAGAPGRTTAPPPSLTCSPFESDTFTSASYVATSHTPHIALASVWALTRLGMLVLLWRDSLGIGGVGREVHVLYRFWYDRLAHGTFPPDDPTWQYPPGAALVIGSPAALPWFTYFQAFVGLTLLADAVVTLALARADSDRVTHGAWMWVCGLPLLLHIPLARYDVQTTAVAVLAVLALRSRPALGGALAGLGAMIKVWPALTLIGTPRGRSTREAWTAACSTAVALLITLGVLFRHSLDFLLQQGARGIQIESLGGTALALARAAGLWPGRIQYRYGAFEYVGPHISYVEVVALLATLAACCWLVVWRVRARRWSAATPLDAAFAAVLLFTLTSRVISPQYMIWLLGLAAVCLTCRETVMRPAALLLLPATALSALAYPVLYEDVLSGAPAGLAVVVVRNGLLLAAGFLACRALWRTSVGEPKG